MACETGRNESLPPYPHEAFGGELLSDRIKVTDISSRHPEPWRNSAERWSWLVSDKPVIYPERKEDRDLRGCHTKKEDSPWVQLSLESATAITGIQVDVFRFHRWHEHLRIWASSDGKVWREIAKDDAVRMRYKFDLRGKNINAKLIRVGRERGFRNEYFALNKILIYGKK